MEEKQKAISQIRAFNRFYLSALDLLGNHYLDSEYSAAEARVLFEIYEEDGCNASHIADAMSLDKSYLSRILKIHEKSGYITKELSKTDSRSRHLHLTKAGRDKTEELVERSNQQIGGIIAPLGAKECKELMEALSKITLILKECQK